MRPGAPGRTIETEIVDYFIFNAEDVDVGAFSRAKTDEVAAHFGIDPKIAYRTLNALAQQGVLLKTRDIMKRHRGRTAVGYQWWEYSWRPGDLERYEKREHSGGAGSTVQERQMPKELSAEEWRAVLLSLAAKIPPTIDPPHVTLIGGVAMALGYGSRRTTKDADVVMTPDVASEVLPAAEQVATQYGLLSGWMNTKALDAGYVTQSIEIGRSVLTTDSIVFDVPSIGQLLAMKLSRFAGDDVDVSDAKILLQQLQRRGYSDVETMWDSIGGLVRVADRSQARHNLYVLWEMLDESA